MALRFHSLRVSEVVSQTEDAVSLRLEIPPDLETEFEYLSGQFLTFKVPVAGEELVRCYSLSSAPKVDDAPQVTVKRVVDGRVSNWINDNIRNGEEILTAGPGGRFTRKNLDHPLVLFAAGSGITPIYSLLKTELLTHGKTVRLLYANTSIAATIFRRDLTQLKAEFPDLLKVDFHYDDVDGFVTSDQLKNVLNGDLGAECFICGPDGFMGFVEDTLIDLGVCAENISVERFISPDDPSLLEDTPDEYADAPCSESVNQFVATLDGEDQTVPYVKGSTMLDAMLDAGLDPPHSCKEAHCGSCIVLKKRGDIVMRKSSILSKREREQGYVILCQSIPTSSDVWVDCDS